MIATPFCPGPGRAFPRAMSSSTLGLRAGQGSRGKYSTGSVRKGGSYHSYMTVLLLPGDPFPDPRRADEDGLVAVTTELTAERVLEAYRVGIFPWFEHTGLFGWFS